MQYVTCYWDLIVVYARHTTKQEIWLPRDYSCLSTMLCVTDILVIIDDFHIHMCAPRSCNCLTVFIYMHNLVGCVSVSTSKDFNQGQPSFTEILWTGSPVKMLCILSLPKSYRLWCSCIIPCCVVVTHTVVRSSAWSINISSFER
jgi:hypothetical protein